MRGRREATSIWVVRGSPPEEVTLEWWRASRVSFSGAGFLKREVHHDLLHPFSPISDVGSISPIPLPSGRQCLLLSLFVCLIPPVKKALVLADVSKHYQVPCQNNSPSLLQISSSNQKKKEEEKVNMAWCGAREPTAALAEFSEAICVTIYSRIYLCRGCCHVPQDWAS